MAKEVERCFLVRYSRQSRAGKIYGLLTKRDIRWLDIGQALFFCVFMERD